MEKTNTLASLVGNLVQDAATTTAHAFYKFTGAIPSPLLTKLPRDQPNRNFGSISGMSSRLNSFAVHPMYEVRRQTSQNDMPRR